MPIESLPQFIRDSYEVYEWRHATAILENDFPEEFRDICEILMEFRLNKSAVVEPGGRKSKNIAGWIDKKFYERGWAEKKFDTKISLDNVDIESPTHSIDCFKNRVALEIEWNISNRSLSHNPKLGGEYDDRLSY